jgi:hypothetical protein
LATIILMGWACGYCNIGKEDPDAIQFAEETHYWEIKAKEATENTDAFNIVINFRPDEGLKGVTPDVRSPCGSPRRSRNLLTPRRSLDSPSKHGRNLFPATPVTP